MSMNQQRDWLNIGSYAMEMLDSKPQEKPKPKPVEKESEYVTSRLITIKDPNSTPTSASTHGDGGALFRGQLLKRAKEESSRTGRSLEEIVADRWGKLEDLYAQGFIDPDSAEGRRAIALQRKGRKQRIMTDPKDDLQEERRHKDSRSTTENSQTPTRQSSSVDMASLKWNRTPSRSPANTPSPTPITNAKVSSIDTPYQPPSSKQSPSHNTLSTPRANPAPLTSHPSSRRPSLAFRDEDEIEENDPFSLTVPSQPPPNPDTLSPAAPIIRPTPQMAPSGPMSNKEAAKLMKTKLKKNIPLGQTALADPSSSLAQTRLAFLRSRNTSDSPGSATDPNSEVAVMPKIDAQGLPIASPLPNKTPSPSSSSALPAHHSKYSTEATDDLYRLAAATRMESSGGRGSVRSKYGEIDGYEEMSMKSLMRQAEFEDDDAFDTKGEGFSKWSDVDPKSIKKQKRKGAEGVREERLMMHTAQTAHNQNKLVQTHCMFCVDCERFRKDLLLSIGTFSYVALPSHQICDYHLTISSIEHVPSSLLADDDSALEIDRFKQTLEQWFWETQRKQCIFIECCTNTASTAPIRVGSKPDGRPQFEHIGRHCRIDCIPVTTELAAEAKKSFFFELNAMSSDWRDNKAIIKTSAQKNLRRSLVKQLPFFHVEFPDRSGFGHVIEENGKFNTSFGLDVLRHKMEDALSHSTDKDEDGERRSVPVPIRPLSVQVNEFVQSFAKYDWTAELEITEKKPSKTRTSSYVLNSMFSAGHD